MGRTSDLESSGEDEEGEEAGKGKRDKKAASKPDAKPKAQVGCGISMLCCSGCSLHCESIFEMLLICYKLKQTKMLPKGSL